MIHKDNQSLSADKGCQTDGRKRFVKAVGVQTRGRSRGQSTQIRKLRHQIYNQKLKILSLENRLRRATSQEAKEGKLNKSDCQEDTLLDNLDAPVRTLIHEQIQATKQKTVRWSLSTIKMTQCILYKSPRCYRKLRQFLKLPSVSTIARRSPKLAQEVSYS